jgi:hypothetical protein
MDLPPTRDSRGASVPPVVESVEARELAELREGRRLICAEQAAEVKRVARLVKRCQAEVREPVLTLGDSELDMDAEGFAHRRCGDAVMCAPGHRPERSHPPGEPGRTTHRPAGGVRRLGGRGSGRLAGAGAGRRDRGPGRRHRPSGRRPGAGGRGDGPWAGLAPRQWRSEVDKAVVAADAQAAGRRRAAAVAARRVRSREEGDGSAVLAVHAAAGGVRHRPQPPADHPCPRR